MKKVLIAIVFILFGVVASAQLQQQSLGGSVTTLSTTQGGLMGKLYFVLPKKDTLDNAATFYPGALTIRPQDTLLTLYPPIYMSNGHFWISVGSAGNGIDSITVSPDSILYQAYNRGNQIFTFHTLLRHVKAGANVVFTYDVDTLVISSGSGSVITDSTQWAVSDSLSTPPALPREGTIFLVGLFATGAFSGHENQIATYDSVPAIYTFQVPDIGDLLYNATNGVVSVWTGTAWVWVGKLVIHHPSDNYGFGITLGTLGAYPVSVLTTNTPRITVSPTGDITLNNYTSGHTGTATGTLQVDAGGKIIIGSTSGGGITALTGDVTASGTGSVAATLATVNSNVGSFTNASITVNGKGLITAASSGASTIYTASNLLNKVGNDIQLGGEATQSNTLDLNGHGLSTLNGKVEINTINVTPVVDFGLFQVNDSVGIPLLYANHLDHSAGFLVYKDGNYRGEIGVTSNGWTIASSSPDNTIQSNISGENTNGTMSIVSTGMATMNTRNLAINDSSNSTASNGYVWTRMGIDGRGAWQPTGGGGVVVTSVSGTTNRITSTGGATPVIDISATFEALLGKVANPLSQFASTTSLQLLGVMSDETGTGALTFANTPTLVTPVLGVATATSINKVAITAPATSATLTILNGKTFTVNNTLTLAGTDGSTLDIGTGGTLGTNAYTSTAYAPLASPTFTGTPSLPTGTIGVTQSAGNSTTALATTAFVTTADNLKANIASPTFTGTVTIPTPFTLGATSVTSTGTQLNYLNAATGTTGTTSTNLVYSTSPTFITPTLGAATATSINGNIFTTGSSTYTGTAAQTYTFPATTSTLLATTGSGTGLTGVALLATANDFTTNGALSTPSVKVSGTWITGGSASTTTPQFLISPSGATLGSYSANGTGLGINAATGFTGDLMNLTLNGAARLSVTSAGSLNLTTGSFTVAASDAQISAGKLTMVAKQIFYGATMTAGGTTGNQTINKPTGSVNIAAAGTTVTVTNSLVTTTSIIYVVAMTNDATAAVKSVVPASGSFVINTVAVTAETKFGFIVVN